MNKSFVLTLDITPGTEDQYADAIEDSCRADNLPFVSVHPWAEHSTTLSPSLPLGNPPSQSPSS